VNADWKRQFDALFDLEIELARTCECGAPRPLPAHTVEDTGGMHGMRNLSVLPEGQNDSVKTSLRREFTPEVLNIFQCATCNQRQKLTQTLHIEAAPELLRLKLSVVDAGANENRNPIRINEHLDLTEYLVPQPGHVARLKYRLISVLYHDGDNKAGHWLASVQGPQHVYRVNDTQVARLAPRNNLWKRPDKHMRAVVLMYQRVHVKEH
jgi:ubiquitin C-terminal hydrolase